jgi:hypothetical protein
VHRPGQNPRGGDLSNSDFTAVGAVSPPHQISELDCLRASRAKQVNGVPDGRRLHKSASAVFGAPEIKCVGGTALARFNAISVMVNTPRYMIADRTYRVRLGGLGLSPYLRWFGTD